MSPTPAELIGAFLKTIEHDIHPLTQAGVSSGSKVFGAAIFLKKDLAPVIVATNHETASPLLHGEINCIQQFYALPAATRPNPKDCIFLATHEPCSLCLSGITWGGFDNHYYLFTYEDTRDLFAIPYDISILEQVFRVPVPGETPEQLAARPLYNHTNSFWTCKSVAELVDELEEGPEKESVKAKVQHVRGLYGQLSDTYQSTKGNASIPLA